MKSNELRDLNPEQIQEQLKQERTTGQQLRFAHAISPLENPARLAANRKNVARLLTEITRRQHEQANTPVQ